MDEFQDRVVQIGLGVLADFGFALAGGYALQAHQLVDRMSEDVDIFTDDWDRERFSLAVETVLDALREDGLRVDIVRRADTFARLEVTDPILGQVGSADLAADFRAHEPVVLSVGPVLAEEDAVATKVATVFSRGYARDYIDLAGILDSGRYGREDLIDLATGVDAGFSRGWFAEALAAADRFGDPEFTRYGVDAAHVAHVRDVMRDWSGELKSQIEAQRDTHRAEPGRQDPPGVPRWS